MRAIVWRASILFTAALFLAANVSLQAGPRKQASGQKRYVRELLEIIDTTSSPDSFLVALELLVAEGVDGKRLIPTLIRAAERVGVFADAAGSGDKERIARVEQVYEQLKRFIHTQEPPADAVGLPPLPPVPLMKEPLLTERVEEKPSCKNDFRTPILPPIREGFPPPICEDPPDEACILRALKKLPRGIPHICEQSRDNIQIVTELIVDKIDPARFFPLVGPARLHHCHWKCTVYYTETIESGYPFPFRCSKPRVEVVYIDKDHLHLAPKSTPDVLRSTTGDQFGP